MSIINEALKKAQQENKQETAPSFVDTKTPPPPLGIKHDLGRPKKNNNLLFIAGFVIIAVISGGIFFLMNSGKPSPAVKASSSAIPIPTAALAKTPLGAQSRDGVPLPLLSLSGIVYDSERPYAIVNNEILSKGDTIEGATVVEVSRDSVKFSFNGKEFELSAK